AMGQHRGQVAHRAAWHEHRCVLPHHRGGHRFEAVDCRVFAVNIVTQIASRISGVGRVTVSLRRSIKSRCPSREAYCPGGKSVVKFPLVVSTTSTAFSVVSEKYSCLPSLVSAQPEPIWPLTSVSLVTVLAFRSIL